VSHYASSRRHYLLHRVINTISSSLPIYFHNSIHSLHHFNNRQQNTSSRFFSSLEYHIHWISRQNNRTVNIRIISVITVLSLEYVFFTAFLIIAFFFWRLYFSIFFIIDYYLIFWYYIFIITLPFTSLPSCFAIISFSFLLIFHFLLSFLFFVFYFIALIAFHYTLRRCRHYFHIFLRLIHHIIIVITTFHHFLHFFFAIFHIICTIITITTLLFAILPLRFFSDYWCHFRSFTLAMLTLSPFIIDYWWYLCHAYFLSLRRFWYCFRLSPMPA